jgi:hypothetical protein
MNAEALLALAVRVEAADGPDQELDSDIHEALFGARRGRELGFSDAVANVRYYTHPETGNGLLSPFRFTGSVEAAEYALPGPEWPEWQVTRRYCTGYHANVGMGEDGIGLATAALALTAAALRARAASVDTHAKRGDATEIAAPSPMSGAVDGGEADSETLKPSLDYPSLTVIGVLVMMAVLV